MKYSLEFVCAIAYIAIWTGLAIGLIGQESISEIYTYSLPVTVLISFSILFYFAFIAGRKSK
uniref:Uncharacterized protein n=1 Tax=viral metagenome TaxID=1070528 RepID=A0A6M3LBV1_9ZZZZ